jgi:transcriptional regulator with XRE-family HTH domain
MANNSSLSLGEVIREARIATGRSLREFSKHISITPSYQSDIENDRRVPAEEVLRATASSLNLNFDELMALAGRFGEQADRYMKRHPTAGTLFRRISEANLPEESLRKLLNEAEELGRSKSKEKDQ